MSFAAPAVLFALIALPAIWWLLRLTPPRPKAEIFPPTRMVAEIEQRQETSARTPWWLTAIRLALAGLLILALAGPTLSGSVNEAPGDGPLLLVVDNSWASARNWTKERDAALAIVAMAEDAERPVALVPTAGGPGDIVAPTDPTDIANRLAALQPQPFGARYDELLPQLETIAQTANFGGAAWLSDGLGGDGADAFAAFLADAVDGPVTVYADTGAALFGLGSPTNDAEGLTVPVLRRGDGDGADGVVIARDLRGRAIGEADFHFDTGATTAEAAFDLPTELRNEIVRLEISGQATAGAVQLLDDRYRRRTVGIISDEPNAQPLLSAQYFLTRALAPFADVQQGSGDIATSLGGMINAGLSVIILADVGTLPAESEAQLATWVANGGTLIRFAGPHLAASNPTLIPVHLREGGRILGGALSWEEPQPLGPYPATSPFFGLAVPADVLVERQVLAEPDAELTDRIWAVLADGTPLVTGAPNGDGLTVLFHVTGDTSWSNLPLSGVFVDMLRRVVELANAPSGNSQTGSDNALLPYRLLDGFGRFADPPDTAQPIPAGLAAITVDPAHPPGLYGTDEAFRAISLLSADDVLAPFDAASIPGAATAPYPGAAPSNIAPWLFAAALALLLIDTLAVLWLSGFGRRRAQFAALALAVLVLPGLPHHADAQALTAADQFAMTAANRTALAYVVTGDAASDNISRAGLTGLTWILTQRTSFEPGDPIGVNIDTDELAFFPLIYWRVTADAPMPDETALTRIDDYMRNGGIVLFDTADQLQRAGADLNQTSTPAAARLREILLALDIPPLEPVPSDHVITKSYYLLDNFPGRYAGGDFWVEATTPPPNDGIERPVRPSDGVSPVLITSNDLAGAWAIDGTGAYLFPLVTTDTRQREYAFRAGVNIVMYALTGNYKSDQIHVPDLLQRLGQ